jgi:hypothetical protein
MFSLNLIFVVVSKFIIWISSLKLVISTFLLKYVWKLECFCSYLQPPIIYVLLTSNSYCCTPNSPQNELLKTIILDFYLRICGSVVCFFSFGPCKAAHSYVPALSHKSAERSSLGLAAIGQPHHILAVGLVGLDVEWLPHGSWLDCASSHGIDRVPW